MCVCRLYVVNCVGYIYYSANVYGLFAGKRKITIFVATIVCGSTRNGNLMPCKVRQRLPPLTEIRGVFVL